MGSSSAPTRFTALRGDITKTDVDAIVNAANESLLGGGGVDGAIHRAAGPQLLEACIALPEVRRGVRCPTGEARITPGFALPARWVIHTVGPVHRGVPDDAVLLASAFRSSLALAEARGLRTIAFPAISCGVFRYPVDEAAQIAARVARERARALDEIRFVLFDEDTRRAFLRALFVDAAP
jgi:O-acetyl-ADP-ribose deacetylase (regulator of RNase III)